ncbi:unnamed protein product [Gongylonema pulchrum]|uniref:Ig-like domain-containing protein n=1 Tax=Gongylonema pulchrum TaxID=637853 RepID=A0A183E4V9_9BILA|nr:unnamed protein product [Gongylonema pulchrum]
MQERFLGFRFTEEPANAVAKAGRVQLDCRYALSTNNVPTRIEWRKDGAELSTVRSTGKVFIENLFVEINCPLMDEFGSFEGIGLFLIASSCRVIDVFVKVDFFNT